MTDGMSTRFWRGVTLGFVIAIPLWAGIVAGLVWLWQGLFR